MSEKYQYNILFVEDEKEIRDNYIKYLQRHFLHVYEAADGKDGYKIYKEKKPEIMIVDINMPNLNGIDLIKKIREKDQITKIIILSAHSDESYLLDAIELKLVKYLIKPISRGELKEALELAVNEFSKFNIVSNETIQLKENFTWNPRETSLQKDTQEIYLTALEKKVLALLIKNFNNTMSYDDIILEVWDSYEEDKLDALKTLVKNIRKKLPKDTIKNVFGVGYKFS